ncbi:hypothetical protein EW093_02385 [Thiospirochaeta perfilievii]|uniref:Galactokinase n=1 Tax=Thiospirochaeta perfilievii TaxID=252967 RepID=A0A5C1Q7Z7_9SPIO|nr:galactokinase family protein [Thiospirochaeta perfilievii]QEN03591.1 hypothetical protein EW093_02385 [Thiospirochaeta perfilievii]
MTEIELKHKEEYGHKPGVFYSCPGKITLSGEHTEYNDGVIISSAINLYCQVAISKRDDNSVRFYSVNYNERKKTSISNIKNKREDRWSNYIKGVIMSIIQTGTPLSGMNITILSDIPEKIGLGSSTAMCLATACCLKKLYNLDLSWLNLVESTRFSESVFMGLYAGLDDALTMFFNNKNSLFCFDAATLDYESLKLDSLIDRVVLLDPGVSNADVEMDYIDDRDGLYELASKLSKGKNNHSLRNYRVEEIRSCIDIPERIKRKAIFIVEEIKRSLDIKQVVSNGNIDLLGRYLVRSHEGLRDLFESTCPEVDWLIKRGVETDGVYGGKSSGEISSGIVVFIMEQNGIDNFSTHIEDYDKIFGFKAKIMSIKLCNGMSKNYPEINS